MIVEDESRKNVQEMNFDCVLKRVENAGSKASCDQTDLMSGDLHGGLIPYAEVLKKLA